MMPMPGSRACRRCAQGSRSAAGGGLRCRHVRQRERPALRTQSRHGLDRHHGLCHRRGCAPKSRCLSASTCFGMRAAPWRLPPQPAPRFVREIFTGTYASDMGPWNPDAGAAMRYRNGLAAAISRFSTMSRPSSPIRSTSAACRPGAQCRLLQHSGCHPRLRRDHRRGRGLVRPRGGQEGAARYAGSCQYRRQARDRRAMCLQIADGCIVGSSLKVDGNTWNAVDPDRAADSCGSRGARAAERG